ncbi:MAG: hypothetical protein D3923_08320 [Candidatus Electrothrix sp. AR3]|nr:hypothetical protein [Candidatus Electrothrix sp. AR3]
MIIPDVYISSLPNRGHAQHLQEDGLLPMKFFNTAGPVNPEDHYLLPPLSRLDLDELILLIQQKKIFVLHALRLLVWKNARIN